MAFDHFRTEQSGNGFKSALMEVHAGKKVGHWIWFIFPQLAGLGFSDMAQRFAIADLPQARGYIAETDLRDRLIEITVAVGDKLVAGADVNDLMGSHIDTLKLISSLTLFEAAAEGLDSSLAEACRVVLELADQQGFPRCHYTLTHCRQRSEEP